MQVIVIDNERDQGLGRETGSCRGGSICENCVELGLVEIVEINILYNIQLSIILLK